MVRDNTLCPIFKAAPFFDCTSVFLRKKKFFYEEKQWNAPDLDPIELIKIRMEEFGYTASDLAKVYGDKGTVSKVLHYKQALSLTMIRKFSNFLRIPPEALTREYSLIGQA